VCDIIELLTWLLSFLRSQAMSRTRVFIQAFIHTKANDLSFIIFCSRLHSGFSKLFNITPEYVDSFLVFHRKYPIIARKHRGNERDWVGTGCNAAWNTYAI